MAEELPELLVADADAWRAWLAANHATSRGVWLVLTKKGGTVTALDYEQAVRHALCFGWIDGQARSRDGETSYQRLTPRRPRGRWSAKNVGRVDELERAGLMTPAGRAEVEAAKADGRWEAAYAGPATIEVPADLAEAIAANPAAQAMFDVLTSANRFAMIHRVTGVKRPETRARNIAKQVDMLARGETIYPQKRTP
ncbi:MAG TPA: YdeI/OmpD-associated family protein [Ilumatobacter sp.]|nr:YdeI/OmpD-associated family protein [Ilumatobacter sp.]